MGNAPGKEVRNYSGSSGDSSSMNSMSTSAFAREYLSAIDNGNGHGHGHGRHLNGTDALLSKKKKEKEAERAKFKTKQIMNLVVKYDENVDGGYLAPYGNYKYNLDYMTEIVRDLIIKRKLAPFYTPLQDFDESWSDEELLEYLKKNLKLHEDVKEDDLIDDYEDPNEHKLHPTSNSTKRKESKLFKQKLKERALEYQKNESYRFLKDLKAHETNPTKYPNIPSDDLLLRLYRNSEECPICFLFYPKLINMTRCCIQPICTECFVQMKRLDPHFPHDEEPSNNSDENSTTNSEDLISEPVKCPFCAVDDFGITYSPPRDFRTGIGGSCAPSQFRLTNRVIIEEDEQQGNDGTEANPEISVKKDTESEILTELDLADPFSTKRDRLEEKKKQQENTKEVQAQNKKMNKRSGSISNSIHNKETQGPRKRRESLPPDSPSVITIDFIRPDWEQKLLAARTKLAKRSAAATALHASSLIANPHGSGRSGRLGGRRTSAYNRQEQEHLEEMLVEEAMRLSLLDEEERKMREYMKNTI